MKWPRKWIAAGQRIKRCEAYVVGRLWSSGYVVSDTCKWDIEDAFVLIQLPSYEWAFDGTTRQWRWVPRAIFYLRSRGWWMDLCW